MDHIKVSKVEQVYVTKGSIRAIGTLHLTAHHLIFNSDDQEIWISYPIIYTVERRTAPTASGLYSLNIRCRDFQFISIALVKERDASDVFDSIQKLTCVGSIDQEYAFFYRPSPSYTTSGGWSIYSPEREFQRMGVGTRTDAWRVSHVNKDYKLCTTYPSLLVVPSRISDNVINYAGKYRSKNRIPALTYLHWTNNASITRSSQPMVGLKQNRSIQDEKLIECIFSSNLPATLPDGSSIYGATQTNLIVDARGTTNAVANVARGAGTENMENYKTGKKAYMGIDNIHVMRDSLNRMVDAIYDAETTGQVNRSALAKSGWLKHIASLLEGSLLVVRNIHVNHSHVLVHCSDGWDRTSQLASLAEICLDPYYRTLEGLQVLIEKDWVSFGHKFADRNGLLSSEKFFVTSNSGTNGATTTTQQTQGNVSRDLQNAAQASAAFFQSVQNKIYTQSHVKETSPVFHQFLDCIHQLVMQNPHRFEFNDNLLVKLHYHLYSCQFGTFLFNSEKERRDARASLRTASVWDYINSNREEFLNKDFDPKLDDRTTGDMGVLFPDKTRIRYWTELFGRQDDDLNSVGHFAPPGHGASTDTSVVGIVGTSQGGVEHIEQGVAALGMTGDDPPVINPSTEDSTIAPTNGGSATPTRTSSAGSLPISPPSNPNKMAEFGINLTSAAGLAAAATKSWFETVAVGIPGRVGSPNKSVLSSSMEREMTSPANASPGGSPRSSIRETPRKPRPAVTAASISAHHEPSPIIATELPVEDQQVNIKAVDYTVVAPDPANTIQEPEPVKVMAPTVAEAAGPDLFDPLGALGAPINVRELTIKNSPAE